jgi:hypothetical protein
MLGRPLSYRVPRSAYHPVGSAGVDAPICVCLMNGSDTQLVCQTAMQLSSSCKVPSAACVRQTSGGTARLCPAPLVWYAASCVALSRRCSFSCLATCPCHQPRRRDCKVLRHCKSYEQAQVSTSCSALLRYTYCSCTYSCMVLAGFWSGRYSSEGRTSTTSATPSPLRSTPPPPRSESNIFSS